MTAPVGLIWDADGAREYELGVDHAVLYVRGHADSDSSTTFKPYSHGVVWNGITNVSESPEGAELNEFWADNRKYGAIRAIETFKCGVEAYMYPDEFDACDGTYVALPGVKVGQQTRETFGLSYRTKKGSDENEELGYKIHLIYGCTASPSERSYATINDSPEAITFSWDIDTIPVSVPNAKETASIVIDSTEVTYAAGLTKLENILYGRDETDSTTYGARLPLPEEVFDLLTPPAEGDGQE